MLLKKNSLDLEITGMSSLFIPLTLWFLRVELTMVIFFEWGQILWCFVCPTLQRVASFFLALAFAFATGLCQAGVDVAAAGSTCLTI